MKYLMMRIGNIKSTVIPRHFSHGIIIIIHNNAFAHINYL